MVVMDITRTNIANSNEKPSHLHYLRDFRVEACPQFKQHQCQQHRPYTCFNWHFANQRRRRPIRRSDGSFNYSADVYCDRYDENTGLCPDGDSCGFLHRVAGDVERKYHLRYYKTAMCVHPTDGRGVCTKNGPHCAFAHSVHDLRQAVHDSQESQNGALLDPENRERTSFVIEDPLWHDQTHVLSCYKTEQCKKPARLCRQGYACPFYHNSKDRRRPPAVHKYRSTPCPTAKCGDEWLEPEQCENGDDCGYCHTRTEQQFHPEIYKSTKCNDMLDHGYCPRAVFCAFAHHDSELHEQRTPYYKPSESFSMPVAVKDVRSNSSSTAADSSTSPASRSDSSIAQTTSSIPSGTTPSYSAVLKQKQAIGRSAENGLPNSYPKAPGFERIPPQRVADTAIGRIRTSSLNMGQLDLGYSVTGASETLVSSLPTISSVSSLSRSSTVDATMQRTLPTAIDELVLDDISTLSPISEQKEHRLLSDLFDPPITTTSSTMQITNANSPFGKSSLAPTGDALFMQKICLDLPPAPSILGLSSADLLKADVMSPHLELSKEELKKELRKKTEELEAHHKRLTAWEEGLKQARQACEAWKKDAEYYRQLAEIAEEEKNKAILERNQAIMQLDIIKNDLKLKTVPQPPSSLDQLPYYTLGSANFMSPVESNDTHGESGGPVCARCGREKRADSRNPSCNLCCS